MRNFGASYQNVTFCSYLDCHHDHKFNEIVNLLIDLNPSDVELNYMLAELCLHYAGKRHQGKVLRFTDKLQETTANQLHNYYKNQLKMANYSGRLAKMIKINNLIRRDLWERLERQSVAKVFNIIAVTFSHPDMFGESGM
uniref:NR LBD domain-containing protein n=1 Tax=Caenorhabditis japonica TaxID=281687 RepID=A0A8R1J055_CAEJA